MSLKITSTHAYTSVGPPSIIPFDWYFPTFLILPYVVLVFKDARILSFYTSGMTKFLKG